MSHLPSDMSSPEHVAKTLQELRAQTRELEIRYKSLYLAAKHGATPGGSLGQIRAKGKSDPTQAAALSPGEANLRRGCRYVKFKIQDAISDLTAAHRRYEQLLGTLEGGVIDGHRNDRPLTRN